MVPLTDELLQECTPLIVHWAGKYLRYDLPHMTRDDLVQEGYMALLQCAKRFNPDAGCAFKTFITHRVPGHMQDILRELDPISRKTKLTKHSIYNEKYQNFMETGEWKSDDDAMIRLNFTALQRKNYRLAFKTEIMLETDFYQSSDTDEDDVNLDTQCFTDEQKQCTPYLMTHHSERQAKFSEVFQKLSLEIQHMLHERYYEDLSLKEIGILRGLSESAICRQFTQLFPQLRKMFTPLKQEWDIGGEKWLDIVRP